MSLDCSIRFPKTSPMYRVATCVEACTKGLYFVLGVGLTILGLASLVVPIVPAIATLLASMFFLSRSAPNVQYWLHDRPLIGRYLKYLDGTRLMDARTKRNLVIANWCNLLASCVCLYVTGLASPLIVSTNVLCSVLSAVFLHKFQARPTNITKTSLAETIATPPQVVETAAQANGSRSENARSPWTHDLISTSPGLPRSVVQVPLDSEPS